jgi:hypothetical protein
MRGAPRMKMKRVIVKMKKSNMTIIEKKHLMGKRKMLRRPLLKKKEDLKMNLKKQLFKNQTRRCHHSLMMKDLSRKSRKIMKMKERITMKRMTTKLLSLRKYLRKLKGETLS